MKQAMAEIQPLQSSSSSLESEKDGNNNNNNNNREEEERFMERLKKVDVFRYIYYQNVERRDVPYFRIEDLKARAHSKERGKPFKPPTDLLGGLKHYDFSELKEMTESFDEKNRIGRYRDGRLFKGKDLARGHDVIVKTWDFFFEPLPICIRYPHAIIAEMNLLREPFLNSEKSMMKLIGFHCDKMLAVVYERESDKRLLDVLDSDEFGWDARMNVAKTIAKMLAVLHQEDRPHGGIDSDSMLVDENYFPKSFHFSMYSFVEDLELIFERLVDYRYGISVAHCLLGPKWLKQYDVFTYGVLLLELLRKSIYLGGDAIDNLRSDCKESIVHESFNIDAKLSSELTNLVAKCLKVEDKPSIVSILSELEELLELIRPIKQQKTT